MEFIFLSVSPLVEDTEGEGKYLSLRVSLLPVK